MDRSGPLIPDWFAGFHPLHLSSQERRAIRKEFNPRAIFLNIPYSRRYTSMELAIRILSTVTAYGLLPVMAKEKVELEGRIKKIARLMLSCGFGLTDLTYVGRMNMPFELGMLFSWGKQTFVVSAKHSKTIRSISDLNFADIRYHDARADRLIAELAKWIEQNCSSRRLGQQTLLDRYEKWKRIRRSLGPDFDRRTPSEVAEMIGIAEDRFSIRFGSDQKGR